MERVIYLLPIVLCMLFTNVEAQKVKFGARAGANLSRWTSYEDTEYDPLIGMFAGPYVNISAGESFSLKVAFIIRKRGLNLIRYMRERRKTFISLWNNIRVTSSAILIFRYLRD